MTVSVGREMRYSDALPIGGRTRMRKAKIATLVLLCILTVGLCGILIYGISGHGIYFHNYDSGEYTSHANPQLVMEKQIALDGIEQICVQYNMNNNDIHIYESEDEFLTIREYNELDLKEEDISTVTVKGSTVEVQGKKRTGSAFQIQVGPFGIRSAVGYTEISLPASYKGALEFSTASGDIRSQMDIVLEKEFQAEAVSGDVRIPNITAQKVSLRSTSGDIGVEAVRADDGDQAGNICIKTSSGEINASELVGELDIESVSGEITIKQLEGQTKLKSTSGNIESDTISGEARIATTSGDISVQRIDGAATAESSSGSVKINAGSGNRTVRTTSGDIQLKEVDGVWEVKSSSGVVEIKAKQGSGRIGTTSGDVSVELGVLTGDLDIDSSSGQARIRLSTDNSFDFKADTTSGDINTFFDEALHFSKKGNNAQGTYGDNQAGHSITIKTTSGDVQVAN